MQPLQARCTAPDNPRLQTGAADNSHLGRNHPLIAMYAALRFARGAHWWRGATGQHLYLPHAANAPFGV